MSANFIYLIAADILLASHVLIAVFVVLGLVLVLAGGAAGWRWVRNPWFRTLHLAAIGFIVVQSWLGQICPLTTWEMALRKKAGGATYDGSFVAHWLSRLLYYDVSPGVFLIIYTVFGMLVIFSWFRVKPDPFNSRLSRRR